MNIFEIASRKKLRFSSIRGELTAEQLWDLHLQSKSGFDLDSIAKAINAKLREVTEESFVAVNNNPAKAELQLQLDIVKRVIEVRQQESADRTTAAARAAERERLLNLLEKKQVEALENLSAEEIAARLKALE